MSPRRASGQAGFTLTEVAVASLVFLIVAVAAFQAFHEGTNVYKRGADYADMQQRTRMAFDQMMTELRLAGFDYNRDGEENTYPDHPDEQLEWIGAHAIVFRGNLDYGDAATGREEAYEADPDDPDYGTECCPIVTTGNDEIVAYALRSEDPTKNTGSLRFNADLSIPRDAGWDVAGQPDREEEIEIDDVDLTGTNPPYTLVRFSFADDGTIVERPLANDVRNLTFTFQGAGGEGYHCKEFEADGTCAGGNQLPFVDIGGLDDVVTGDQMRRSARAGVRRIVAELVGMTENPVKQYKDSDPLMPTRPKLALEAAVVPQNLGLRGRPDLADAEGQAPTNVTLCAGQCNTIRIEWDEVMSASGYFVKLHLAGVTDPILVGSTPGVSVSDTDPPRVFAAFQRIDAAGLVNGARVYAKVQARFPGDETSEDSEPSAVTELLDVTRPSAPTDVRATGFDHASDGWPDVSTNLVPPDTTAATADHALENRIIVSWVAPFWALNVTDQSNPGSSWTTAAGAGSPPLACDVQPADMDGDGNFETERTRLREQFGTIRYLVFRSTNPRFVPTDADFVGAIQGDVDSIAGRVAFVDRTEHSFTNGIFNSTQNALANCTTYYYRIRAVDDCWSGSNPAALGDPHVSPFAPPLNTNPTASDSDDTSMVSPSDIGPAIPGYAIPKAAPRKPTGLRFNGYDRRTDDGDGFDATVAFEAVKLDGTLAADGTTPAYEDVTITQYQVFSHATNPNFTLADIKNQLNGVRLDKTITLADVKAGRISRDDENGDGTITAAEDESVSFTESRQPSSGLRVDFADTSSRYYKVVAIQCRAEDTVPDDDATLYDYGTPSEAFRFPCDFGGGPFSTITINSDSFPTSVTSDAIPENPAVTARYARLVVKDRATGDRAVTASPGKAPSTLSGGLFRATFSSADIAALTDNFGNGNYLVSVEWDDSNGCMGVSDSDSQILSPPTCCLSPTSPVIARVTTTQARNTVSISCSALAIRLMKITVSVDNANGTQQERFSTVAWDEPDAADDRTFTTNRTNDTFDMTANPPVLTAGQTGVLNMTFNRNAVGDNVTVTYEYKIGGVTGTCTYTGRIN